MQPGYTPYHYCFNDPVNGSDPSGLKKDKDDYEWDEIGFMGISVGYRECSVLDPGGYKYKSMPDWRYSQMRINDVQMNIAAKRMCFLAGDQTVFNGVPLGPVDRDVVVDRGPQMSDGKKVRQGDVQISFSQETKSSFNDQDIQTMAVNTQKALVLVQTAIESGIKYDGDVSQILIISRRELDARADANHKGSNGCYKNGTIFIPADFALSGKSKYRMIDENNNRIKDQSHDLLRVIAHEYGHSHMRNNIFDSWFRKIDPNSREDMANWWGAQVLHFYGLKGNQYIGFMERGPEDE